MPLQKILLKPGVNRENTRYTTEGGWYDCDKIRFRQGTPEKIGGWKRISADTFLGVCRSLWAWVTLGAQKLIGVGTNLKFYLSRGGAYLDITPIRATDTLSDPFYATAGSSVISVHAANHNCITGDFVIYMGGGITDLGGAITASVLANEFQVTVINNNIYTIDVGVTATAGDTGHGGTVIAQYELTVGPAIAYPLTGWGAGGYGYGLWGEGVMASEDLRLWSQSNFGEDLIFGHRGGEMYYWNASLGDTPTSFTVTIASPAVATFSAAISEGDAVMFTTTGELPTGLSVGTVYYITNVVANTCNLSASYNGALINTTGTQSGSHYLQVRGIPLTDLAGASDVPIIQNTFTISDSSRFVLAFGTNDIGSVIQDPMLVRWSDQEDPANWTPTATNQAGSIRLSHGSKIVSVLQVRQEILTWTDSSLYSLQYLGPPYVWGTQLMGDNLSIMSQNCTAIASGVAFWMGKDKFYSYNGTVQTLRCDLRQYIFSDINMSQADQVFASTNEGFNEVWWFYCSENSTAVDKYVVYNYREDVWYYGTMDRTAWLDSGILDYPIAATYINNLVNHEDGIDDDSTAVTLPIEAFILSSEFDIGDGHNFAFIWRLLPDLTFRNSTSSSPQATMTLYGLRNSGSGYNNPESVGGSSSAVVTGTAMVPVEQFTGQVYIRIRGRQMAMKIASSDVGTTWQLGAPRIDIKQDGRR